MSIAEVLLRWFPAGGSPNRLVLTPYIESYWRHNVQSRPFAFRTPALAAVEAAAAEPEVGRVAAVLSATASGFHLPGAHRFLQRLRPVPPA